MDPHTLTSPDVGLLVLWLVTPAQVDGGGTVFAPGSVRHVARLLSKGDQTATSMHSKDVLEGEEHVIEQLLAQCRRDSDRGRDRDGDGDGDAGSAGSNSCFESFVGKAVSSYCTVVHLTSHTPTSSYAYHLKRTANFAVKPAPAHTY